MCQIGRTKGKRKGRNLDVLVYQRGLGLVLEEFYQGREHSMKWFLAFAWCVDKTEKQRVLLWLGMSSSSYEFMLVVIWNLFPWAHWRQFPLSTLAIFSQPMFFIPGFMMAQGIGCKDCLGEHKTHDCHAHRHARGKAKLTRAFSKPRKRWGDLYVYKTYVLITG